MNFFGKVSEDIERPFVELCFVYIWEGEMTSVPRLFLLVINKGFFFANSVEPEF